MKYVTEMQMFSDLDLNYLNNSNLDQTHQRATLDLGLHCVRCARSPAKGHCISDENQVIR